MTAEGNSIRRRCNRGKASRADGGGACDGPVLMVLGKMLRRFGTISLALALSACAAVPPPKVAAPVVVRPPPATPGLERVIGQDARTLEALFGPPDQDLREGSARRLQFVGAACVLDAYLYPPAPGREALVSYVDARLPSGDDFDRASCVAALVRSK